MRRLLVSFAALAALSTPALATGGFSCAIDDGAVSFAAEGGFSYSIGGGILNFRGELALPDGPKGLEKTVLAPGHLAHDWLYDGELRLLVHAETGESLPFASADLVVMTTAGDDETVYSGDYTLILHRVDAERVERTGKVSCTVG